MDSRNLAGIKIVSIGKTTSTELARYGIIPDQEATDESSLGLINLFREKNITCENILLPCSDKVQPLLPDGLTLLGNQVKSITVYKSELPANYKIVELV